MFFKEFFLLLALFYLTDLLIIDYLKLKQLFSHTHLLNRNKFKKKMVHIAIGWGRSGLYKEQADYSKKMEKVNNSI
jgi:hypothetical protein